MINHSDAIMTLVTADVDDDYEGTGVNDRTLGMMYHLKKYSKAADTSYDLYRNGLNPPQPAEQQQFATDGKFHAVVQPRAGRRTLDESKVQTEIALLIEEQYRIADQPYTVSQCVREAATLLAKCYNYGKPTFAVSIVRSSD